MITSLSNKYIKDIMKLKQKKYRDETSLFLIEGFHLVEEARKAQCIKTIITTLDEDYQEETIHVSTDVMNKLAFTKTPQPIMDVCYAFKSNKTIKDCSRTILLDNVQDPGNVGTIIRSALALGYDQLIMSNDSVDLYNDKVIRSTQGALFKCDIIQTDLKEAIYTLKDYNIRVIGTSLHDASSIDECKTYDKMAFVMGNEGNGVSKEILDLCDQNVYIPISNIESLNVAIACAITMYHFRK